MLTVSRIFIHPIEAWFNIQKKKYYQSILAGEIPEELELDSKIEYKHGYTKLDKNFPFNKFLLKWKNPGFKTKLIPDYLIDPNKIHLTEYMNLGWNWKPSDEKEWFYSNNLLYEKNIEDFFNNLKNNLEIKQSVIDRLNKIIETDIVIMYNLSHMENKPERINLISGDIKLAKRILTTYDQIKEICLIDPVLYQLGLYEMKDYPIIEDQGAILFADLKYYNNGIPIIDFFEREIMVNKIPIENKELSFAFVDKRKY